MRNLGLVGGAPALRSLTSLLLLSTVASFRVAGSADWLASFSLFLSPAILCKLFNAASSISLELSLREDFEADTEKETELFVDFSTSFSVPCGLLISFAFSNLSFCLMFGSFTRGADDSCGLAGSFCLTASFSSFSFGILT